LESDHLCQTVNKNHGKKGGLTMIYHDWPWFTMIYHDLPWSTIKNEDVIKHLQDSKIIP
jgi:hypothetical protein